MEAGRKGKEDTKRKILELKKQEAEALEKFRQQRKALTSGSVTSSGAPTSRVARCARYRRRSRRYEASVLAASPRSTDRWSR